MKLPLITIIVVCLAVILVGCSKWGIGSKEGVPSDQPASRPSVAGVTLPPTAPSSKMQDRLDNQAIWSGFVIALGVVLTLAGSSTPIAKNIGWGLVIGGAVLLSLAVLLPSLYAITGWVTILLLVSLGLLTLLGLTAIGYYMWQHRSLWTDQELENEIRSRMSMGGSGSSQSSP